MGAIIIALLQTQIIHRIFHLSLLQLPLPSTIVRTIAENIPDIGNNMLVTLEPALSGILLGSVIGYCVALFVTAFPNGGYGALFMMTIINSLPIVALAPLTNKWFEIDFISKLVVITIAACGAMAVNAFKGLNDLPENTLAMLRVSGASKVYILTKLRIPASMPSVFTAFRISIPAAMLATIISEFFASETAGLGFMIKYSLKVGNHKHIGWAYIVAVAVLSIVMYLIVCQVEKRAIKWHVSQRLY